MSILPLPDRPLKLSRHARPGYFWSIIGGLLLVVAGVFLLVWQGPGLQHDWIIRKNPVVVWDSEVQNGECTTRKAIFTDCSAHLVYSVDDQRYEVDAAVMFVSFDSGDYMVDVVRSGDDPSLATISIGLEKLWNRIATMAVFLLFTLGGGLMLFLQGTRAMRNATLLSGAGRFSVVPVSIANIQSAARRKVVTINDPSGKRPKAGFAQTFGKKEEPLIRQDQAGRTFGLAVKREGCEVPVLLDTRLERLNLTEAERQTALAALG